MFDKSLTYHKSARGTEAMATRNAALTPRLRSMLILVDGKRTYAELAKLGQLLGDYDQVLTQLADLGFIEPQAGTQPRPTGAAAPATPAASTPGATPAAATVSLADAKRFAVRLLTDMLGPTGEAICIRIEDTRNAQEFMAAIQKAESMLRQIGSAQKAERFAAEMASRRPQ